MSTRRSVVTKRKFDADTDPRAGMRAFHSMHDALMLVDKAIKTTARQRRLVGYYHSFGIAGPARKPVRIGLSVCGGWARVDRIGVSVRGSSCKEVQRSITEHDVHRLRREACAR